MRDRHQGRLPPSSHLLAGRGESGKQKEAGEETGAAQVNAFLLSRVPSSRSRSQPAQSYSFFLALPTTQQG